MKSPAAETQGPTSGSCDPCRRRKLKCDRTLDGCSNCKVTEAICCYPSVHETGRKKRGPYRKGKTKNEIELERTVRTLEAKNESLLDLLSRINASRLGENNNQRSETGKTSSLNSVPSSPDSPVQTQQLYQTGLETSIQHQVQGELWVTHGHKKSVRTHDILTLKRVREVECTVSAAHTYLSEQSITNELLHVISAPSLGFKVPCQFPRTSKSESSS